VEPLLLQMLTIRAFDDDSRSNGVLHEGIRQGSINGESRAIARYSSIRPMLTRSSHLGNQITRHHPCFR